MQGCSGLRILCPLIFALGWGIAGLVAAAEEAIDFGRFGEIHIYKNTERPKNLVLFISGDGGWNLGVIDMAKALADLDALVAGIDITHFLRQLADSKEACSYPAADLEGLSQFLQKHYQYENYVLPVLVGYSSGATLVYAALVQGPPNTFRGGISLGFCPDLPLTRPLCRGSGLAFTTGPAGKGFEFQPSPLLATPWIAFQGEIDQVCSADAVYSFAAKTRQAEVVRLPGVGHGFSVQRNWMPQFRASFGKLVARQKSTTRQTPRELKDLPIVEVPVDQPGKTFAVIVSGDGGWAGLDKSLAEALATRGIPTVGLDSLRYFWTRRTPDESAIALQTILHHYFPAWNMDKVLLIGYSLGAEVLPFMASRLPPELKARTSLIALLGAEHAADFEFSVADWLPGKVRNLPYKVAPEVAKLENSNLLCIYGADEAAPLCPDLETRQFKILKVAGGHHFGGDYKKLAEQILQELR